MESEQIIKIEEIECINKSTTAYVANNYTAYVIEKKTPLFRIDENEKCNIFSRCKSLLNKSVKIAFVNTSALKKALWGIGGIKINDYILGANGTYDAKIEPIKMINAFSHKTCIYRQDITSIILLEIKHFINSYLKTNPLNSLTNLDTDELAHHIHQFINIDEVNSRLNVYGLTIENITVSSIIFQNKGDK